MKLRTAPGEFRAAGHRNRRDGSVAVGFAWSADVDNDEATWLQAQFDSPRATFLNQLNPAAELQPAFLGELARRGYDLSTLRFSIFTKEARRPRPARLRSPRQRPGLLTAQWARLPDDPTPDIVCTWGVPCSRRDSSYLLHWLTIPLHSPHVSGDTSLMAELTAMGFDVATLKFRVRHSEPNPAASL